MSDYADCHADCFGNGFAERISTPDASIYEVDVSTVLRPAALVSVALEPVALEPAAVPTAEQAKPRKAYEIHADGSCRWIDNDGKRPAAGGYACMVYEMTTDVEGAHSVTSEKIAYQLTGAEVMTNQYRTELLAVLTALRFATNAKADASIFSDSTNTIDGCNDFKTWQSHGWKRSATRTKPIPELELWKCLAKVMAKRERLGLMTRFTWVKGHAKNQRNQACDAVAGQVSQRALERLASRLSQKAKSLNQGSELSAAG